MRFLLNDKEVMTDLPPGMTLLDFIRYHQHLMGTKIGCREGDCGACTVLVGSIKDEELQYETMTSCLMPLANANGKHIVTIEGINFKAELNPIQQAMADEGATQCGFCTPGFVMSLAGFCLSGRAPTKENAVAAIDGNICRCTGYKSIERAAVKISAILKEKKNEAAAEFVSKQKILPPYFTSIKNRLQNLSNPRLTTQDSRLKTHDSRLTPVSGGTDLYVQRHEELVHAHNQYLFDDPALKQIVQEEDRCVLGGAVTVTDLLNSSLFNKIFPAFSKYAKLVSSTPIRNMATVAGNFINASPIGDLTIFFLALGAKLHLDSSSDGGRNDQKSMRTVSLKNFYKGYKQFDKQAEEIVETISFRIPPADHFFNFEKVSKRTHLDIASVNTAIYLELQGNEILEAGLSAGGVAPVPLFLLKTSAFLKGKEISDSLVEETIDLAKKEISPISDARGSKEYKSFLLGQLIRAHFSGILAARSS